VFLHLLTNAEDALGGEGKIILKTSENEHFVMISVKDNGIGIAPEIEAKIFQPLFTTKNHHQKSGLGLTTTKQIIEAHHGKLTFQTQVGEGTEFIVYLPKQTNEGLA